MVDFNPNISTNRSGNTEGSTRTAINREEAQRIDIDFRKDYNKALNKLDRYEARAERAERRGNNSKAEELRQKADTEQEIVDSYGSVIDRATAKANLIETLSKTKAIAIIYSEDPTRPTRIENESIKIVDGKYYLLKNGKNPKQISENEACSMIAKAALLRPNEQDENFRDIHNAGDQLHTDLMKNDPYYARHFNRYSNTFNYTVAQLNETSKKNVNTASTEGGKPSLYALKYHTNINPNYKGLKNLETQNKALTLYRNALANWEDGPMPEKSKMLMGGKYIDVTERTTLPDGTKAFVGADGLIYPMGIGGTLRPAV